MRTTVSVVSAWVDRSAVDIGGLRAGVHEPLGSTAGVRVGTYGPRAGVAFARVSTDPAVLELRFRCLHLPR